MNQAELEGLPVGAIFADTAPLYHHHGLGEHFRKINDAEVASLADGSVIAVAGFIDPGEEYEIVALPVSNDRRHFIELTDEGWTVQHPVNERFDGSLFNCTVRGPVDDPGTRGRFVLEEDGSFGEEVPL